MNVEYLAKIEALLFTSDEPVPLQDLARVIGLSSKKTREYIEVLIKEYEKDSHGIEIKEYDESYLFVTKPVYEDEIKNLHNKSNSLRLTQAALETLAIIAYKQPVTRAEIEEIRGVKAEKTLLTLSKYGLIQELGRKETIGNPIVYGTTNKFLQSFNLRDLSELPEVDVEEEE